MNSPPPDARVGLLFSGGMDSAILLHVLLAEGRCVQPLYVAAGLYWEREEQRAVRRFLDAVACPNVGRLVTLALPVSDVYEDHWSVTGRGVPDAASPDEAVFLHGRNALLLIKAALWCQLHRVGELALGVLGTNPFADASPAFFDGLQVVLECSTDQRLRVVRPFGSMTKRQVMRLGRQLPLELTFSCIAPVDGLHCGRCNKCQERRTAFRLAEMQDPTQYASPPRQVAHR